MDYIDKKYINLLSPKLRNFKWKGQALANFSCPICGDSQRKKNKARGFMFSHKNSTMFKCHNCSVSLPLKKLLQQTDTLLYSDYCLEKFKTGPKQTPKVQDAVKNLKRLSRPEVLNKRLIPLNALKESHPCKAYCDGRKIPKQFHKMLYYASNFRDWVVEFKPEKKDTLNADARLVIPFFDKSGKHVIGAQGRSLDRSSTQRYVSIRMDENQEFIFGQERLDWSRNTYVVEGPIDSLFLPNCCAMATAGKRLPFSRERTTLIYDAESRNKQIVGFMDKALDAGFAVCFWPDTIKENDINDMILAGMEQDRLLAIVQTNSFRGARGKLELSKWRNC